MAGIPTLIPNPIGRRKVSRGGPPSDVRQVEMDAVTRCEFCGRVGPGTMFLVIYRGLPRGGEFVCRRCAKK